MKLDFTKMHGAGNDYIYVNCMERELENPSKAAVLLSDRHFGIGSDGLILILPSDRCDFRMRMFNADGSEGEMCGNGVRCVAKYVYDRGFCQKTRITLETLGGDKTLFLEVEKGKVSEVSVDMGVPSIEPLHVPVITEGDSFINSPYTVLGHEYRGTALSMGNPHCVIFMDDIEELNLCEMGPAFENHEIFPERVNTEFAQIIDSRVIKMRVWERGSGETLACGTGACACVVAACLNGHASRGEDIRVLVKGGELVANWRPDGHVMMRGPAAFICDGVAEIDM